MNRKNRQTIVKNYKKARLVSPSYYIRMMHNYGSICEIILAAPGRIAVASLGVTS